MTDVEFDVKDYKRMLSVFSEHFGDKKMTKEDQKLKAKIEVMHDAEVAFEESMKD